MSAALHESAEEHFGEDDYGDGESTSRLSVAPDAVEIHRHAGVAAGLGLTSSAVSIAYFARAATSGAVLDWVFALGLAALGIFWLAGLIDARTPLFVTDSQGIRIRLGRAWRGLPWSAVHHVEHRPRQGLLRDGRLVVEPHNLELIESELDRPARRHLAVSRALYGAPLAVPLGLTTRVVGAGEDLSTALEQIAESASQVVILEPDARDEFAEPVDVDVDDQHEGDLDEGQSDSESIQPAPHHRLLARDPRPALAALLGRLGDRLPSRSENEEHWDSSEDDDWQESEDQDEADAVDEAEAAHVVASQTPVPLRESSSARREEVRRDVRDADEDAPKGRELHRPGSVSLVEETVAWGDRVRPISRAGDPVDPIVVDDFVVEPAEDPVIGPVLAAARTRLGLSVDALASRTRIRPHVIESIEVDDFAPCGGDFYARGHLRTLARVLGIDVSALLVSYDERYAHAPINPRRVFEAELATGAHGSIRGTRGGPNWSVLVAVVMALVLCWSVARLLMDSPPSLRSETPVLNGSGGPQGTGATTLAKPVSVTLAAPGGGAHIVVRDGAGEVVFKGGLAAGATRELKASPPVRVQSSDGAVTVAMSGVAAQPVGEAGVAGQGTFVPR